MLGLDLDCHRVSTLQCSEVRAESLFRIANQFGIPWYLVYDGDKGKKQYEPHAVAHLDGAGRADRLRCLEGNVEQFLREHGFEDLYSGGFDKIPAVSAAVGRMKNGTAGVPDTLVPDTLKEIVEKAVALAEV